MTALVRAELLKLRTMRLVPGLLLGLIGVVILYVAATISQTDALELELSPESPFGASVGAIILVLLLGVTVTAGEYRHGTITATFLTTPVRERVLATKLLAALILGLVFGIAAVAVNVLIAWPALAAKGADVSPLDPEPAKILGATLLACALWAALGAAIGAAARNQVAAIVGAVVWFLIAEPLVGALLDDVGGYLPGPGLAAILGADGDLSRTGGVLVTLGWIGGIGAVGVALVLRDDVT